MTKTKGFLLTASLVLATIFTLSCSDDKKEGDGGYLSCSEAWGIVSTCSSQHGNGGAAFDGCLESSGICGGNAIDEACKSHYDSSCPEFGGGDGGGGYTGPYEDPITINGQTYKTVKIGTQIWMAENLNIDAENSQCYDDDPANCVKYGRMYDWETASTVCPSGWHLPTDAEWEMLISYVESNSGCSDCAGAKLKANRGWADNGEGTDNYGFSALPGGEGGEEDVGFRNAGYRGYWWSASAGENGAYCFHMRLNRENVNRYDNYTYLLYSVRCVKD